MDELLTKIMTDNANKRIHLKTINGEYISGDLKEYDGTGIVLLIERLYTPSEADPRGVGVMYVNLANVVTITFKEYK